MKNLLLAFVFACVATPSFAQFSVGLSAGGNQSFIKWPLKILKEDLGYEPALGWRAALLGEWQVSKLIGVRAELAGQVKSQNIDLFFTDINGEADQPVTVRHFLQYWEGSLLCQVSPVKKIQHLYLLGGCTVGRLTKAWRTTSEVVFEGGGRKQSFNPEDSFFNRNDIAADFGLGGNIPLGSRSSLKVEGRFQYGLNNFCNNDNVDAQSNTLMLSVGYLHRL